MSGGPTMRDGENEAFIVDRYLDSLLTRRPADATDLPAELRSTAEVLVGALPRYHPSFGFAETLASRLAGMAASGAAPAADDVAGDLIPFPRTVDLVGVGAADVRVTAFRPAVLGGVLTSAAISLAAGAYVAWRRSRPAADPMARAIRAAARRRTA